MLGPPKFSSPCLFPSWSDWDMGHFQCTNNTLGMHYATWFGAVARVSIHSVGDPPGAISQPGQLCKSSAACRYAVSDASFQVHLQARSAYFIEPLHEGNIRSQPEGYDSKELNICLVPACRIQGSRIYRNVGPFTNTDRACLRERPSFIGVAHMKVHFPSMLFQ